MGKITTEHVSRSGAHPGGHTGPPLQTMVLNDVGKMMKRWWEKLPGKFNGVELDIFQIMPNHLHGIIKTVGVDPCVDPDLPCGRTRGCAPTLGTIIQWFKTMTTNEYINGVKTKNWPIFPHHLWQRNYYEHIIRSEPEYFAIREYIQNNQKNWANDTENV